MSLYFDMVINCEIREDTSEELIDAIRHLTDRSHILSTTPNMLYEGHGNIWEVFSDYNFLAPKSDHYVISNFKRIDGLSVPTQTEPEIRQVVRHRLQYCGSWLHDDYFYENHLPFVHWLAGVAHRDYIGYYKETDHEGLGVKHLKIEKGKLNL